ncbi:MAG TPA: hypothetical protein VKM55_21745 [Candidatus Lokiarchaeia archaeon]|nr:hypothetical protein [Candidatus Lokiarchaeia archaeon]
MENKQGIQLVPRGFAGVIARQVEPLNSSPAFKQAFKNAKPLRILLNATNADHAALIVVENGNIHVEGIPNKPTSNLARKNTRWDGFLSCTTRTFLELALGRLPIVKMLTKLLSGEIKITNIVKVLQFQKIMAYLA